MDSLSHFPFKQEYIYYTYTEHFLQNVAKLYTEHAPCMQLEKRFKDPC